MLTEIVTAARGAKDVAARELVERLATPATAFAVLPSFVAMLLEITEILDEHELSWLMQAWSILLSKEEVTVTLVEKPAATPETKKAAMLARSKAEVKAEREARKADRTTILDALRLNLSPFAAKTAENGLQCIADLTETEAAALDETVAEAAGKLDGETRSRVRDAYHRLVLFRLDRLEHAEATATPSKGTSLLNPGDPSIGKKVELPEQVERPKGERRGKGKPANKGQKR